MWCGTELAGDSLNELSLLNLPSQFLEFINADTIANAEFRDDGRCQGRASLQAPNEALGGESHGREP